MIILHNNRFTKNTKLIDIDSKAFQYGYGIFETMRTFNKIPFQSEEHLRRLLESAGKLKLTPRFKKQEIKAQIEKIATKSAHKNQRIKIILTEKELIITSNKLSINQDIYKGVSCQIVQAVRGLPEFKSLAYLESYLAHREARDNKHFEAILSSKSEIFEGAHSNLFWFENDILCTRKDKVLPGITRNSVIKISPFKLKYKTISPKELLAKKEIFLTNSISGIIPVIKINKKKIGTGAVGPNTSKLMQQFNAYVPSDSKHRPQSTKRKQEIRPRSTKST